MKIKHTACVFGIVVFCFLVASIYVQMTVDDTFTFLRFVHNMLNGNGMAFNPGEQTYGFTSVTWLLLLWSLLLFGSIVGSWFLVAKWNFETIVPNPVLIKASQSKQIYDFSNTFIRTGLMLVSTNAADLLLFLCCLVLLLSLRN